MNRLRHSVDEMLFGPESAARLVTTQTMLVIVIGLRIALTPFATFARVPADLVVPVPALAWLDQLPPTTVIVAVQLLGSAAAVAAAVRRWPRQAFAIAWLSYLFLAGLRASRGKVLHNDLLLLWTSAAFLLAPIPSDGRDRTRSRRYGWPVRTSIVVTALIYWFAAYHKLRRSGFGWVFSDNLAYVMRWAPVAGEPQAPAITHWFGENELVAQLGAGGIITLELMFPIVIWWRTVRPLIAASTVILHIGTWLLLGLDYWVWAVTVPIILIDWSAWVPLGQRSRPPVTAVAERAGR